VKRLHNVLARQLTRLSLDADSAPEAPDWLALLLRVSQTYADADQERYLLDRSQDISSREMQELYDALHRERDQLESRVAERTAALAASEARFRSLTSLGSDWYWEQDRDFRFTSIAGNTELYSGHTIENHVGRTRWDIDGYEPPQGGWAAHRSLLEAHQPFQDLVLSFRLADGSAAFASVSGEPVFAPDGAFQGYRGIGRDITQETRAEERVQRLARFDPLTGLFNRPMFFERLDHALAVARRRGTAVALLFIDLDRFKNINDTFGHLTGDEVIRTMAQRLTCAVRETDTLARLGGDEFIVLAENLASASDASELAQRLVETLAEPVALAGTECHLGASIGIAAFPADGDDAATLLKKADIAMYRAKDAGRSNFQFYSEAMNQPLIERMVLGAALQRALEQQQFVLLYQPKVDVATGALTGVEALIRWQHPERGLLPPEQFIPVAEETGLIRQIGRWVLRAACVQGQAWRDAGLPPIPVAVNLSAREFNDERLAFEIAQAVVDANFDAHLLELEITETLVMQDPDRAVETLGQLKAMGVRISIDDFGTGHSSLARLSKLPVDSLKIDGALIRDIATDPDDAAIASAVIAMAASLRLTSIAEGVEEAGQLAFLKARGCDEMQGYLTSRPVPAADIATFVRRVGCGRLEAVNGG
jgi:diguanylate cyclase (GGDEF)-like protein/PAS domain S-box-containing protein